MTFQKQNRSGSQFPEALTDGALQGIRVIDLSRQAPGPYCSMLLADFGADVILVEPPGGSTRGRETNVYWELELDPGVSGYAALRRNKRSICLDLKNPDDQQVMAALIDSADVIIEGFRPGVAKRLGIDAETVLARNPSAIYCSITGFGQNCPESQMAGHDLNYLAMSGALEAIADQDGRPVIPLNLLADFAGGGLMAAYAIMVALLHRERTGQGQSIDLAMLDGTLSILTHAASLHFARGADLRAGHFFLNGGLPQYGTYRSADGRWFAVAALEPWFYETLLNLTGRPDLATTESDEGLAVRVAEHLKQWFGSRDSGSIRAIFAGYDVCVTMVNTFEEALDLAASRGMVISTPDGSRQIGVAPRLSLTPGTVRGVSPQPDHDRDAILAEVGMLIER